MFGSKKKKTEKKVPEVNLLELIPERVIEYEVHESNLVTLLTPRFRSGIMKKVLQPRLKKPFLKVDLDEIGSEVWLLCDGRRNVQEIADRLKEKFREKVEPCHERLGLFFKQLERAGFIRFTNLEECLSSNRTHTGE